MVMSKTFFGHPIGLSTLFFTEMWERFSYYGLRPLLVLFMAASLMENGFGMSRGEASAIVGIYAACVYLAALPGGWIADRVIGLRRAILIGAALISLGHIFIGVSSYLSAKTPFFIGLIFVVMGTGLMKPNISAIVGDLYPEGGSRRDAGFSIYYMGINIGAFLGNLVTGFLGEIYGWHFGFAAAGVGMLIGLVTFSLLAKSTLGTLGLEKTAATGAIKLILFSGLFVLALLVWAVHTGLIAIHAEVVGEYMTYVLALVAVLYFVYLFTLGGLSYLEKQRVAVIFILFFAACVFWSAFEQAPTSLNLFASDFTNRSLFGWTMPATWFQLINSFFVIALAPVFAVIWVVLGARGKDLSATNKFATGLFLTGVGFAFMIWASNAVLASGGALRVSMWWLTLSYFFQTLGELSISPVGLSSMTKLAPKRFAGQMMGVWFLADSIGSLISGLVGGSVDPEKLEQMPYLFTVTTVFLLISALVLFALSPVIKKYLTEE
jgi:POT family proton-dependent oligopeptide transporter